MNNGNTASFNNPASGTRCTPCPSASARTPTSADLAVAPARRSSETNSTGGAARNPSKNDRDALTSPKPPGFTDESHIDAGSLTATVRPLPSANRTRPSPAGPTTTSPPTNNRKSANPGSANAAAVFTTNTCRNPAANAVTRKSTPANTSAYTAVDPDNDGFGKLIARPNVNVEPLSQYVANGPDPPPENTISDTVATGATTPSGRTRNVVSTATHDPSDRCTRAGTTDDVTVNEPSGFANV